MLNSRWLKALVVAGGIAALPLTLGGASGIVSINTACATGGGEGGTCCMETASHCYPNGCSQQSCMEDNRYWRTDGKPCSS